jgi:hypothetical protein
LATLQAFARRKIFFLQLHTSAARAARSSRLRAAPSIVLVLASGASAAARSARAIAESEARSATSRAFARRAAIR